MFNGDTYSANFLGINYGGNGVVGGGDDSTVAINAAGSTPVNALSAVAGQTTCAPRTSFVNASVSSAVPEPGTWALLGLGGALLWSATRRRRK